jgi:thioester reductase-like protein
VLKNMPEGKRSVGKPRMRWLADVENDLMKMGATRWRKIARDSDAWKLILKEGGVLHGPYSQWRRSNVISLWQTICTLALLLSEVYVQWTIWLFSVVPW